MNLKHVVASFALKKEIATVRIAIISVLLTLAVMYLVNWEKELLPAARLVAHRGSPILPPYQKDYDFTEDWFTGNVPFWKIAMVSFQGKPNLHYLEIGLYEGRSAIWMLENVLTHPTARLTGIDIFTGLLKERYLANIEKSGFAHKVTTIVGPSQEELRKFPLNSFDIVYIDGSHAADDVLEDAILGWRLLKAGGLLVFDDYRWKLEKPREKTPKLAIDIFFRLYGKHFDVIHNAYQVILRKKPKALADKTN